MERIICPLECRALPSEGLMCGDPLEVIFRRRQSLCRWRHGPRRCSDGRREAVRAGSTSGTPSGISCHATRVGLHTHSVTSRREVADLAASKNDDEERALDMAVAAAQRLLAARPRLRLEEGRARGLCRRARRAHVPPHAADRRARVSDTSDVFHRVARIAIRKKTIAQTALSQAQAADAPRRGGAPRGAPPRRRRRAPRRRRR